MWDHGYVYRDREIAKEGRWINRCITGQSPKGENS